MLVAILGLIHVTSSFSQTSTAPPVSGQSIRGGSNFAQALLLKPNIIYHLDHHQPKAQYDYFYVELKRGQRLTAHLSTPNKGVKIVPDGAIQETNTPYAGFRLLDFQYQEINNTQIAGEPAQRKSVTMVMPADGKIFLLLGSPMEDMPNNVTFNVRIDDLFDGNDGRDAGNNFDQALALTPGDYSRNWLVDQTDPTDFYVLQVTPQNILDIQIIPLGPRAQLTLTLYDADQRRLIQRQASKGGDPVLVEDITPVQEGPLYVQVTGLGLEPAGTGYVLKILSSTQTKPAAPSPKADQESSEKLAKEEETLEEFIEVPLFSQLALIIIGIETIIIFALLAIIILLLIKRAPVLPIAPPPAPEPPSPTPPPP